MTTTDNKQAKTQSKGGETDRYKYDSSLPYIGNTQEKDKKQQTTRKIHLDYYNCAVTFEERCIHLILQKKGQTWWFIQGLGCLLLAFMLIVVAQEKKIYKENHCIAMFQLHRSGIKSWRIIIYVGRLTGALMTQCFILVITVLNYWILTSPEAYWSQGRFYNNHVKIRVEI